MKLFKQYFNYHFVDIIIMIAISDIQFDFDENHLGQTHCLNHASIFAHSDVIVNFIQFEISKDRVKEIDSLLINYFCSFIDLASRSFDDKQIEWRMIFDLSFSNDYFVNNNIFKKYDSLVYEMLENAIRLMTQIDKEIVMMK